MKKKKKKKYKIKNTIDTNLRTIIAHSIDEYLRIGRIDEKKNKKEREEKNKKKKIL